MDKVTGATGNETGEDDDFEREVELTLVRQVPLGIVFARILVVSAMSFSAALAIFFLVGGIWLPALAGVVGTIVFMCLMFFIERGAESSTSAGS
jgi:hypothetical protein